MRTQLSLLTLGCALIFGAGSAQAKVFDAQSATLDNGMEVVVVPNHLAPLAHVMVWYKIGSSQETPGTSGSAHFLEHLMFKGTKSTEPGAYSRQIRAMGGEDNAFTSKDYTAYYATVPIDDMKQVFMMEADRMVNLDPPLKDVASERDVVLEERRMRTDSNPAARLFEQLQAALFPSHPYGRPVIGWMGEVSGLKWEQAGDFYHTWYAPGNAILVVSGDTDLDEVLPLAKRSFGRLKNPKSGIPTKAYPVIPDFQGSELITLSDPLVTEPAFYRGYRVPSAAKNKDDALALQLLENILDSGAASPLYKTLVVEKKLAVSASLSYSGDNVDEGSLWVSITPKEGVSFDRIGEAVNALFNDVIENGISETDLAEAKTRLKNAAIFARDSLGAPASIIGQALATGSTLDDVENWPEDIDKVTPAQIQDVAKTYLAAQNGIGETQYVTGYLEMPKGAKRGKTHGAATPPSQMSGGHVR